MKKLLRLAAERGISYMGFTDIPEHLVPESLAVDSFFKKENGDPFEGRWHIYENPKIDELSKESLLEDLREQISHITPLDSSGSEISINVETGVITKWDTEKTHESKDAAQTVDGIGYLNEALIALNTGEIQASYAVINGKVTLQNTTFNDSLGLPKEIINKSKAENIGLTLSRLLSHRLNQRNHPAISLLDYREKGSGVIHFSPSSTDNTPKIKIKHAQNDIQGHLSTFTLEESLHQHVIYDPTKHGELDAYVEACKAQETEKESPPPVAKPDESNQPPPKKERISLHPVTPLSSITSSPKSIMGRLLRHARDLGLTRVLPKKKEDYKVQEGVDTRLTPINSPETLFQWFQTSDNLNGLKEELQEKVNSLASFDKDSPDIETSVNVATGVISQFSIEQEYGLSPHARNVTNLERLTDLIEQSNTYQLNVDYSLLNGVVALQKVDFINSLGSIQEVEPSREIDLAKKTLRTLLERELNYREHPLLTYGSSGEGSVAFTVNEEGQGELDIDHVKRNEERVSTPIQLKVMIQRDIIYDPVTDGMFEDFVRLNRKQDLSQESIMERSAPRA